MRVPPSPEAALPIPPESIEWRTDRTQLELTWLPRLIRGGSEDYVLRGSFRLEAPSELTFVRTFLGVDTGDIVECSAEVIQGDRRLYARSMHKEEPACYDAWDGQFPSERAEGPITVNVLCRVTGNNRIVYTPRPNPPGPLSSYFEAAVVLSFR